MASECGSRYLDNERFTTGVAVRDRHESTRARDLERLHNSFSCLCVLLCCGPLSSSLGSSLGSSFSNMLTARPWPPPSRPPTPAAARAGGRHHTAIRQACVHESPSSRGSGCESWVRDPALVFYPSTHDPRAAPRDCAVSIRTRELRYLLRGGREATQLEPYAQRA